MSKINIDLEAAKASFNSLDHTESIEQAIEDAKVFFARLYLSRKEYENLMEDDVKMEKWIPPSECISPILAMASTMQLTSEIRRLRWLLEERLSQ